MSSGMYNNISAVILAGGANKRFGGITKATVKVGGRTIVKRMTDVLEKLFGEILIVTNTPEEFTEFRKYKIVKDIIIKAGPLGGIDAAIENTSNRAVFIFAGDMPFLNIKVIEGLINNYNEEEFDAVVPRIGTFIEPLHAIYKVSVGESLKAFVTSDENHSVQNFLKKLYVNYINVEKTAVIKSAFTNINNPDDLAYYENN
jgi:molybdopterin-guanine dinucleotide biosynthesis protein A